MPKIIYQAALDDKSLKPHTLIGIIDYLPKGIVSKTISKKNTGNITITSLDEGEELSAKISPFDNYIQIIEGTAELIISGEKHVLRCGEGIIIPAHAKHHFNATERFKMISTVIKSGYED